MIFLKYLLYGWIILIAAVVVNLITESLGGATWYEYLSEVSRVGLRTATMVLHPLELLFLFILYPGVFGLVVYVAVSRN